MNEGNIPLLRKAIEWAEAEAAKPPELCEWEQSTWIVPVDCDRGYSAALRATRAPECGTCYCIAGFVAQAVDERYATTSVIDGIHSSDVAGEALGISHAHPLFDASNSIEDVRRIAEEIAGERL